MVFNMNKHKYILLFGFLFFVAAVLTAITIRKDEVSIPEVKPDANKNAEKIRQDVVFNPDTCRNPDGKAYFAAGDDVFGVPYTYPIKIRGGLKASEFRLRPDPTQPEGCYENPITGTGFGFGFSFKPSNPERYPKGTRFSVESFSLIAKKPGYWGTQISSENGFIKNKRKYNQCTFLDNGLEFCKASTNPKSLNRAGGKLKADESIYKAPLDQPFILSCIAKFENGYQRCSTMYNYTDYLRVSYRFNIKDLPLLEVIEFDKYLRSQLDLMKIKGYPWPIMDAKQISPLNK